VAGERGPVNRGDYPEFEFSDQTVRDKTILVAGGTGGLGSAVVALLARDGASVIAGYLGNHKRAQRLQEAVRRQYDRELELVEGDIRDEEVRSRYLNATRAAGGLYGLVCLTGDPARAKFDGATEADLQESVAANYLAPILLARAGARQMQENGTSGAIVLFSTMQAVALFDSSINYAGPKAALIHAARIMARQWGGPQGIRVNVVAPGVNRAGMALASIASGKYDFFVEQGIIPRFGRAEDVARVVRLLVEPDNYITGQVITVDGGLTIRK
jgi:NAD(P)-dependent dehydrogenase (short-subunit alcohol dehydrogenase family)